MAHFTESVVEDAALAWLGELGYAVLNGPNIAVGEPAAERSDASFRDVVLEARLRRALKALNPDLPPEAIEDAFRKLTRAEGPSLVERNRAVHRMFVNGVPVEYRRPDGSIAGAQATVMDFDAPEKNDWLAVNQFTVAEGQHTRRPDIVLFVNGLPLAVLELKNAADESADVDTALRQLQTYQAQIPSLFAFNTALVTSDGITARIGSLGAGREWFKPWRTITGEGVAATSIAELEVLLKGVFDRRRFLDFVRYFVAFEDDEGTLTKKIAGITSSTRSTSRWKRRSAQPAGARSCGSGRRTERIPPAAKLTPSPAIAEWASCGTHRARERASRWRSMRGA